MPRLILLVEDNPDDVELTLEAFRESKSDVVIQVARDGAEALDFLFAQGDFAGRDPTEIPSLVLLDLKLPKVHGLEVLRRIRSDERTMLIPVVILTSSTEDEDVMKSYRLCCNSYMRKPLDFDDFSEAIRQMEKYWLFLNIDPTKKNRPREQTP